MRVLTAGTARAVFHYFRFCDYFLDDQLLAQAEIAPLIDADKTGVMGHSLGGVTGYYLSYGVQNRDRRIYIVCPDSYGQWQLQPTPVVIADSVEQNR